MSKPTIPTVPPPSHVEGVSPYIDASIRRTQLETEQARILKQICAELNIDPRIERRQKHKNARTYRRTISKRTSQHRHYFTRDEVIRRDNATCHLCGKTCEPHEIHIDHVIPLARGGQHTLDNVKVACAHCNMSKGAIR